MNIFRKHIIKVLFLEVNQNVKENQQNGKKAIPSSIKKRNI